MNMDKTIKKILIGTGVVAGIVLAITKYTGLNNLYKLLIITPKLSGGMKNIKIALSGITIPLDIDFANRTDQKITVQINAIDILYKKNIVSQSTPNSSEVVILPNSVSTLKNINLFIPVTSLISAMGSIIPSILAQGSLSTKFAQLINSFVMDCTCTFDKAIVYSFRSGFGVSTQVNTQKGQTVGALGLTAAADRKIKPFSDYINYIPPKTDLKKNDLIVVPNGTVEDTLQLMHKVASLYKKDTEMLAKVLQGNSLRETVNNMFYFVYNYIQYVPDSSVREQVRTPLRTLWDRKGDCDCYAVLIASMCNNLNIPFKFRIAAYGGRPNYQHVYVVVPSASGDLICDPVVDKPFYEKQPSKYKDFPKK